MDVQFEQDGSWKRIKPAQAKELAGRRRRQGPEVMGTEEIRGLVGEEEEHTA